MLPTTQGVHHRPPTSRLTPPLSLNTSVELSSGNKWTLNTLSGKCFTCAPHRKFYQHTKFHKQTKNQWARDDPAFVVISSLLLAVAALLIVLRMTTVLDMLFLTNAYLREEAPNSHVVEQRLYIISCHPSSCPWFHTCIAVEPAVHGGSLPELDCIDLVRLITQLETLELLEFHLVVFKTHHCIFSWSLDPRLWKLKCTNTGIKHDDTIAKDVSIMILDEVLTPCLLFFLVQSLDRNDTAADNLNQLSVTLPGENNIFPLSNRSSHCPISYFGFNPSRYLMNVYFSQRAFSHCKVEIKPIEVRCLLFGKVNMIDPFSRCKLYASSASSKCLNVIIRMKSIM
ncbi:hypothetical protein NC651_004662 [Populus alba x Populus x berolinensis]|nr:hypothetical protein NC651_004662 [Populus alba x Populus x berolinensis]